MSLSLILLIAIIILAFLVFLGIVIYFTFLDIKDESDDVRRSSR